MPEYDLSSLSTRSFENLIQAISTKAIAPGVIIFGDGPDGGREATYEGKMPFPSSAEGWDGYCVIQAKFLQRPHLPRYDGLWLAEQLRREFESYKSLHRKRRKPEFFILATNVILTPGKDIGTKDKIEKVFQKYKTKLGIKGWRVWDYDQIKAYLDGNEDIRHAYSAWITPGDVLSQVIQWFKGRQDNFVEVMANFLAKELLNDQYVNLEQAGHAAEDRVPLARVFVDLPASHEPSYETSDWSHEISRKGFVKEILEVARDNFAPSSMSSQPLVSGGKESGSHSREGRYVLVGGPGQGKTTVGQFACQLFRVSLLSTRPQHLLSSEVRQALTTLTQQCRQEKLALPQARRFPLRIVLNEFAVHLQSAPMGSPVSLLSYIANLIRRRTDFDISLEDLRAWLSQYPWLLILDGLDEVPSSSNRDDVLKKVEEFWVDATQVNADVLVLATTRPQGYNEDFSPKHYSHHWLVPLSSEHAMNYAERLVEARFGNDQDRKQKIIFRLKQATTHEATVRLMRSPLQITIMATLVDQIGRPPQDRWRLFHEYYQVIYRREMQREIPAAQLLREHRKDIDIIHSRVAVLLQIECEISGGTDARMSSEKFKSIVESRLIEEGYSGEACTSLQMKITEAAANRLVFLVGLQADQIGFEIRSLQEFMAAEELMQGEDTHVQARLRQIAPIASWRNVFLFAAGSCFAEAQHLRDTIHTICVELNNELAGEVGRRTRAGSLLAVDLLEDGVAFRQPKYGKLLTRYALQLLDVPPSDVHRRIADLFDVNHHTIFEEELNNRLKRVAFSDQLGAWATILNLVTRDVDWAKEYASKYWPHNPDQHAEFLKYPFGRRSSLWLRSRIKRSVAKINPIALIDVLDSLVPDQKIEPTSPLWARLLLRNRNLRWRSSHHNFRAIEETSHLLAHIVPLLGATVPSLKHVRPGSFHDGWAPFVETLKFLSKPDMNSLARALREIGEPDRFLWKDYIADGLPWVIAACINTSTDKNELEALATKAEQGDLGNITDWCAAEKRWDANHITLEDILYMEDSHWPFDDKIATRGYPFSACTMTPRFGFHIRRPVSAIVSPFLKFYSGLLTNSYLQKTIAYNLVRFINRLDPMSQEDFESLTPDILTNIVQRSGRRLWNLRVPSRALAQAKLDSQWIDFLDFLGHKKTPLLSFMSYQHAPEKPYQLLAQALVDTYLANPTKTGLLALIGQAITDGIRLSLLGMSSILPDLMESHLRDASILIKIAEREPTESEIFGLATTIIQGQQRNSTFIHDIVSTISSYERFGTTTELLLLKVYDDLPAEYWLAKQQALSGLVLSFQRRRSGLNNVSTWHSVRLSPGLEKLLST